MQDNGHNLWTLRKKIEENNGKYFLIKDFY